MVEAWCPPTSDQSYLPLADLIPEHVVPLRWPEQASLGDFARGRSGGIRLVEAMQDHCRACAEEIDAGQFDLIFGNTCMFMAASPIARYARTKAVLYLNEPYRRFYEACPELVWLQDGSGSSDGGIVRNAIDRFRHHQRLRGFRAQAKAEKANAAAFQTILVNSYFSRESILRAYGLNAKVCYLGIDTGKFSVIPGEFNHQSAHEKNYVIGVGMFTRFKNIEFVIRSLATVKDNRPRLLWIGNETEGDYFRYMVELAASLNVSFEPKIRLADDEMVGLLRGAFAFVYAPRLEPFGLTPVEAGACGLPVIGVAEGGVRESVVHGVTGLLVDHDPVAFGAAIVRLRDDPKLASELGKQGRRNAEEMWSHEAAIDRLESKLYKALKNSF
jgi:glycosyltransferase involved in cell wall biosynthesis